MPIHSKLSRLCPESDQPPPQGRWPVARISQGTEVSGTRPKDRMRRASRRGSGAPRRATRRTGKADRGSEEPRPARPLARTPGERGHGPVAAGGGAVQPGRSRRDVWRPNEQAGKNNQAGRTHADQPPATKEPRAARAAGRGQHADGVGPHKLRNRRGQAAPARRHLLPGMSRHRAPGRPSPGRTARAGLLHFLTSIGSGTAQQQS